MDPALIPHAGVVRFGIYELASGELRKAGIKVRLQEQPLQILTLLLERPGEIVTRDEICKRLWPDGTFVDFDHSLNAAVMRLREALDDSADNPCFIETVHRRGYRFLYPVEAAATRATRLRPRTLLWVVATASAVLLVAAPVVLNLGGLRTRLFVSSQPAPKIESIAVLPLKNLMNDPAQDYFVEGMHDALITELSKVSALTTISRTSTLRYKRTDKSIPEIARELNNVDAIVEGSVLREGDRVRISVQLIHAPTDRHLWAQSFDRERSGTLVLTSEVALAIANEIRVKLTPQERALVTRARPVNPEAFDAYLKGWRHFWLGATGDEEKAIPFFNRALEIDPSYALAHSALAMLYSDRAWRSNSEMAAREDLDRAKVYALKALELDDTLADPLAVLASIREMFDWDWAGADSSLKRAMELNRGSFSVSVMYHQHLMAMARFEEALRLCLTGRELDPVSAGGCAMDYHLVGDYDRALKQWSIWINQTPKFWAPHMWQGFTYLQKGMHQEALASAREAVKWAGDNAEAFAHAGHVYGRVGLKEEALGMLKKVEELSPDNPAALPVRKAIVYSGLGEKDQAFANLEKAFQQRSPQLYNLQFLPGFDPLRSDSRYKGLVRRMEFPE